LAGRIFSTWYFPKILRTCTNLLRKQTMEDWYGSGLMDGKYLFGDSVLSAWVTSRYKVGYVPAVTAVYRVSPDSALRSGAAARAAFYESALQFDTAARAFFKGNKEYPAGYRWESAVGLWLWAMRAKDLPAAAQALRDLREHFTFGSFFLTGVQV